MTVASCGKARGRFITPSASKAFVYGCVFLLLLFFAPGRTLGDVTVLIYHRFGEDRYPTTNIGTTRFREQLTYLRDNSYQVIALAEMVKALATGDTLPDKAVVITIDDGYRSFYRNAWPLLRDFGYPFTVFLYVKATDQGRWDYMTWKQVRELRRAGVDFQSHGYSHYHMGSRPAGLDNAAYKAWLKADLAASTAIIRKELGYRPTFLAAPYGEYNRLIMTAAGNLGFKALLTQDPGAVGRDTDPLAIPREPILGYDWSTMEHFKMVLRRVDLPVTGMQPDIRPQTAAKPGRFGARLLYPERYLPGSLRIYVSELGWQPAKLQGDFLSIKNSAVLRRRLNRVAISGREKGTRRSAVHFWMLLQDMPPGNGQ